MDIRTRDEGRYHIREMLVDDQLVSWLTIIDYQMRIGSAVVRMAGIGGVETHHKHRMQGHMRVLFEDTVQYMLAQGYDISMLFGIPNFYPKFGYAVCLPWPKATVQTRDAELAQTEAVPCNMRPVGPDDLSAIIDLYNQRNASRTCSLVRTAEYFKGFTKGTGWDTRTEAITLEDGQGGFAGYAAWDKSDQTVNVVEVESISPSFYPALLYEFARQAIARRCGHITLFMPPDHPFAQFVQRYGCEWSIKYMRHSDGMMRILNQASLIEKITPELKRTFIRAP
ncbi:MAG: GNAT family N-acetyltransferase [Chloroflexi bacterium]|nr:GNAT family N-acetyltransferase [Chloroflexota bacterium]